MGGAAETKTGPNNASAVVWAIGEFFFFFHLFFFFWMLTNVYCIFIMVYYIYNRKGGDDENRPKQMCLASFGP